MYFLVWRVDWIGIGDDNWDGKEVVGMCGWRRRDGMVVSAGVGLRVDRTGRLRRALGERRRGIDLEDMIVE